MLRWLSVLVVALALVAAGCGGGDDEAGGDSTVTVTETTDTDTTTDETTTETSDDDVDAGLDWASEDCQSLIQAYVGLSAAIAAASSGQDVSGDIDEFAEYVDKVPDEIRDDVEILAAAYGTFVDELTDLGFTPGEIPSADQLQALQDASESVSTSEVQAAGERLNAWTTANCS